MLHPGFNVAIGIPTYRRPHSLKRLLASIAEQRTPFIPHVIIADNEGEGGAGYVAVCELQAEGNYPFPLHAIAVAERGISQVRNSLMQVGFGELRFDALAMVDDDEWVEPDWLVNLVEMHAKTGADIVSGHVLPEFEGTPPAWVKNLNLYWRSRHAAGQVDMIHGTTNILMASSVYVRFSGEWFDPQFGLSGGEDKEFFVRLERRGARFAFAPQAISHEHFGASRMTMRWALERAYRIGSSDVRVLLLHSPSASSQKIEALRAFLAFFTGLAQFVICAWSPPRRTRGLIRMARQAGKISALLGRKTDVYTKIHGK